MPVYEFACRACGHRLDELRALGDDAAGSCPACGGDLRRVFGRVAVIYSGWGFKRTDGLVSEDRGPRKDFRVLKQKAEEIAEGR
jgi:putative FmdB family regulatory protein